MCLKVKINISKKANGSEQLAPANRAYMGRYMKDGCFLISSSSYILFLLFI